MLVFLTQELPLPPLPPSDSDATECLSWLDKQSSKSVVYISFGTAATPAGLELKALAEAVEERGIPYLWCLKDDHKHHLPNGFIKRISKQGKLVSTGVFVTHCGANSVFESVANGVPMICRPMFGDHWMNGRVVEEIWGIGVRVEGHVFAKSGVLKSLKIVLGHEHGKQMRERIRILKELVLKATEPIHAIETNSNSDTKKLVTYRVIFSFISLFEHDFMGMLQWARNPFYGYSSRLHSCKAYVSSPRELSLQTSSIPTESPANYLCRQTFFFRVGFIRVRDTDPIGSFGLAVTKS
ncbi:hypothetical protein PVK06_042309 [Gossypium arboreum]|uniref:Uncharacterized protein n=1 Tax=Gossypium arboreum TaxID=29729 RepID=A0ABR0MMX3_GOSAR|nr:hypothetical protein PVK06_042309 [Gossypium arboreum]